METVGVTHHIKTLNASRACIHQFQNLKGNYIAATPIYILTKKCLHNNLTTKFARIKVPHSSPAAKSRQIKKCILSLKDETRFLYAKKSHS